MTTSVWGDPAEVPKPIREALSLIIEQLWDDEERHFRACAAEDPNAHVGEHLFVSLCWVRTWLEGRHHDPQHYIGEM